MARQLQALTLRRPAIVAIKSPHPVADATDRIRRELERQLIEPSADRSRAQLRGRIEGFDVRLHYQRVDLGMRSSRSWSAELRGQIEPANGGSELRGSVSVGHPLVWLFLVAWRILAGAIVLGGAAATVSSPGASIIVLAGSGMIGLSFALDAHGTRRGRIDAEALVGMVREALA